MTGHFTSALVPYSCFGFRPSPILPKKGHSSRLLFGPCLLWPNGRPSQLLLSTFMTFWMGLPVWASRKETFTHSPLLIIIQSLSASSIHYDHSILFVQFRCLTIFLHNLSPSPLWSTSWSGASSYCVHFFTQSVSFFRNTCPYHHSLFCCSTKIISSIPNLSLSSLYLGFIFYVNITHPSDHSHCHLIFFPNRPRLTSV